ncbi:acyl-CoA thioesterase 2 isoform X2 [Dioscorea cayenensis subsp. rotundata]|uniref:acyl-CoA hydrolase n=1 Tax=Dioscorea cayennensis subsp. rotundata TaxID=55577 RepID=A0AB40BDJ7_DIOCR|nr:acyl-CoA thioesterase 2 isoform X2 [Dioscorea cayenensis subsp. rotundata]
MDREAVIEFLGQVPLLQRLPSSSLMKVAELVQFKSYDHGDYVVREGETGQGIYFIWEGQAEVIGPSNGDEGNRPELLLRKYDYFGYGTSGSVHQVNVIALSKLTCLVLPHGNGNLLQPKSIWNAEGTPKDFSLVEHILHLEPIDADIFRGFTLPDSPSFRQVFGGQFIGQALAAASKTVDCLKHAHSLHAYFLVAGDNNLPIVYQVHRARDGNSFATRQVDAKQNGVVVFSLMASFQKNEVGFEHQNSLMPLVPLPETLPSMEELRERRLTDPRLPMEYRKTVAREKFVPWPIEIRFCDSSSSRRPSQPSMRYWFRARGKLSDDQALHRCVLAYASDLLFVGVSLNPHRRKGLKTTTLSLDHSIWFHRTVKADDWLLYSIESPSACGGRGFVTGLMFNRNWRACCFIDSRRSCKEIETVNWGTQIKALIMHLQHLSNAKIYA